MTGSSPISKRIPSLLVLSLALTWFSSRSQDQHEAFLLEHKRAQEAFDKELYRDAFELFKANSRRSDGDSETLALDLQRGHKCLKELEEEQKLDDWLESVAERHPKDWLVLATIANCWKDAEHDGVFVRGQFCRSTKGPWSQRVDVTERDDYRAFQLFTQAIEVGAATASPGALARLYRSFAEHLAPKDRSPEIWNLHILTDLRAAPPIPAKSPWEVRQRSASLSPVDSKGHPVFHKTPKSWNAARTNGERWRWLLSEAKRLDPSLVNEIDFDFAEHSQALFGVQTMRYHSESFLTEQAPTFSAELLESLLESETLARLAAGPHRFSLPEDYDFIAIWKRIFESKGPPEHRRRDQPREDL